MREHAFDAHPDEIAVLAVVADPLFELSLVCALDQAAIDMSMIPAVAEPAEAFTKTPGVPGRISEGEPDDLCRFVRQGTFRNLPDLIDDGAGLVEDQNDPAALVMQTGKCFRVLFAPWDCVCAPQPLALGVGGKDRSCGRLELVAVDHQPEPFRNLRPCFRAQL